MTANNEIRSLEQRLMDAYDLMCRKADTEGRKRHGAITLSGDQAKEVRLALRHALDNKLEDTIEAARQHLEEAG